MVYLRVIHRQSQGLAMPRLEGRDDIKFILPLPGKHRNQSGAGQNSFRELKQEITSKDQHKVHKKIVYLDQANASFVITKKVPPDQG